MSNATIADDFALHLQQNERLRSRVGNRIGTQRDFGRLPEILVTALDGDERSLISARVRLTCKAKTSSEAVALGAAVKTIFAGDSFPLDGARWVAVEDRSGYDSASKAYRRVIAVERKA